MTGARDSHVIAVHSLKGKSQIQERIRAIKAVYELKLVRDLVGARDLVDELEHGCPFLIPIDTTRPGFNKSLQDLSDVAEIEILGVDEVDDFMRIWSVMDA